MSGSRVGTCPGCAIDVQVRADGKFARHRAPTRHNTGLTRGECPWSCKPAPESGPRQLELEAGEP